MKRKDLLLLLAPSLIVVVAWVIFNIYHSSIDSTISDTLNIQLSPITPNFDNKAIEEIRTRKVFSPAYEFSATSPAILNEIPAASPSPGASGATLQNDTNESSSVGAILQ